MLEKSVKSGDGRTANFLGHDKKQKKKFMRFKEAQMTTLAMIETIKKQHERKLSFYCACS